ncbi:hypothetical protein B0H11DRAFT_2254255 [Mycena galericulata]|nr:hypothetical protein B0H11DRAFT_2254255 [Mycena galericulata]
MDLLETHLPLELERKIFELVARLHPEMIPILMRVAHRVLAWLEPVLYGDLRFDDKDRCPAMLEGILARPASFLASTVRHVLVSCAMYREALCRLLQACPGIVSLTIPGVADRDTITMLGTMHIERLYLNITLLLQLHFEQESGINLIGPLCSSVTHLAHYVWVGPQWLEALSSFPMLTHVALNTVMCAPLQTLLATSLQIKVLIMVFFDIGTARSYAAGIGFADLRLVVATSHDYIHKFHGGLRGEPDIWLRAENFVARKKRGEIEEGCYFLDGTEPLPQDGAD